MLSQEEVPLGNYIIPPAAAVGISIGAGLEENGFSIASCCLRTVGTVSKSFNSTRLCVRKGLTDYSVLFPKATMACKGIQRLGARARSLCLRTGSAKYRFHGSQHREMAFGKV